MKKNESNLLDKQFSEQLRLGRTTFLIKREFSGAKDIFDCVKTAVSKSQAAKDGLSVKRRPH